MDLESKLAESQRVAANWENTAHRIAEQRDEASSRLDAEQEERHRWSSLAIKCQADKNSLAEKVNALESRLHTVMELLETAHTYDSAGRFGDVVKNKLETAVDKGKQESRAG